MQILFWNIGNLNNAFHSACRCFCESIALTSMTAMDTALSMSKWDAGGGLQTLLDNLLPDKDPAAKSSSMWLDVISLLLLVVPERALLFCRLGRRCSYVRSRHSRDDRRFCR